MTCSLVNYVVSDRVNEVIYIIMGSGTEMLFCTTKLINKNEYYRKALTFHIAGCTVEDFISLH